MGAVKTKCGSCGRVFAAKNIDIHLASQFHKAANRKTVARHVAAKDPRKAHAQTSKVQARRWAWEGKR